MKKDRKFLDHESNSHVSLGRLVVGGGMLLVWQVGSGRFIDPFYFSSPWLIAKFVFEVLFDPSFYKDLATTGLELVAGYLIGSIGGILSGAFLSRWKYLAKVLDPYLLAFNSIPRIALAPMLIVWFGIGMSSKVFLAATLVFFIMFFNTLAGIRSVSPALLSVARIQGATERQLFTKVMLPSASAWIFTGLKMSLPFALVGVILGEFLVSSVGLGYRLNAYATSYNPTGAIGMIVIMMIIMMFLTAGTDYLDRRLMGWRDTRGAGASATL